METFRATTFTLGSSTVITLPKKLGIPPGVKAIVKKTKSGISIKTKTNKESARQSDLALIKKLAGSMKFSSRMTPEEMNRVYDEDVYGKY